MEKGTASSSSSSTPSDVALGKPKTGTASSLSDGRHAWSRLLSTRAYAYAHTRACPPSLQRLLPTMTVHCRSRPRPCVPSKSAAGARSRRGTRMSSRSEGPTKKIVLQSTCNWLHPPLRYPHPPGLMLICWLCGSCAGTLWASGRSRRVFRVPQDVRAPHRVPRGRLQRVSGEAMVADIDYMISRSLLLSRTT